MLNKLQKFNALKNRRFSRFVVNGIFATFIHYIVLVVNIEVFDFVSAGLANLTASFFGIFVSFFGNKYFVFESNSQKITFQILKFYFLYLTIAIFHGLILFVWSDFFKFSYHIGFIIASCAQLIFSYLGNKFLIFKT